MFRFIAFSAALAGLCLFTDTIFPGWLHPQVWIVFGFMCAVSLAGHLFLQGRYRKNPENWVNPYLLVTVFRLVLGAGFVIVSVLTGTPQPYIFLRDFFLLYFFYAGFEIYWLVSNLRRNFK